MNKLAILPGDGIGPEITQAAVDVLEKIEDKHGFKIEKYYADFGGVAIEQHDTAFPEHTKQLVDASDAVLLGAVGGPQWDNLPREKRPETALLAIRKHLDLYTNLRFLRYYDFLKERIPIKESLIKDLDLVICRELVGGIYFGEKGRDGDKAWDIMSYTDAQIRRIVKQAFEIADKRPRKKLASVDKANVLETSRMWRAIVKEEKENYPEVEVEHFYVDNAALQLILNPTQFDVIVTENMFGDILSDEAACFSGSLGMLPSASLGEKIHLYEPIHGSAPEIAGKNIANPIATILSVALALDYSFDQPAASQEIKTAVDRVLAKNHKTIDIADQNSKVLSTDEMAQAIAAEI